MGNNLSGSGEIYPTIDQLWVYPVKVRRADVRVLLEAASLMLTLLIAAAYTQSCAGIQLPSSLCTTEGLEVRSIWRHFIEQGRADRRSPSFS